MLLFSPILVTFVSTELPLLSLSAEVTANHLPPFVFNDTSEKAASRAMSIEVVNVNMRSQIARRVCVAWFLMS